ncbi:uncharacterized protein EI90DRAFT_3131247 [Cantharellus anzutake]|uniref:uncharacterized protein n=1 Tax=Cantharellus anzutake TaxID=1750568 RepID=UPI0019076D39|nr:uncharacterized protein EI90DRAFT_3131247 [Cantharellus anzutake]KAF8321996.1 hypothetical protein EI90DRAFT_3131247 [Cantharellus anzutake]
MSTVTISLPGLPPKYHTLSTSSPFPTPCTVTKEKLTHYVHDLISFLAEPMVAELTGLHPNQFALSDLMQRKIEWGGWVELLSGGEERLSSRGEVEGNTRSLDSCTEGLSDDALRGLVKDGILPPSAPQELVNLVNYARMLSLDRTVGSPIFAPRAAQGLNYKGLTAKKAHEVLQLSKVIYEVLGEQQSRVANGGESGDPRGDTSRPRYRVVDVGAGQGYLSRQLAFPYARQSQSSPDLGVTSLPPIDVLVIESESHQLEGATRRDAVHVGGNIKLAERDGRTRRSGTGPGPVPGDFHDACSQAAGLGSTDTIGSLTYKQARISRDNLRKEIYSWIRENISGTATQDNTEGDSPGTTALLLTGLHACGSLTPSILHSFLDLTTHRSGSHASTTADDSSSDSPGSKVRDLLKAEDVSLVVVGCCYNLMTDEDFPLSKAVHQFWEEKGASASTSSTGPSIVTTTTPRLTRQHLQLACQSPSQWVLSGKSWSEASLARRKVVYRALLGRYVQRVHGHDVVRVDDNRDGDRGYGGSCEGDRDEGEMLPGSGPMSIHGKRLGRMRDSVYSSWETFLKIALERFDLPPTVPLPSSLPSHNHSNAGKENPRTGIDDLFPKKLYRQIELLHVLQALVGPVIESLIVVDRVLYVAEGLERLECWSGDGQGEWDPKKEREAGKWRVEGRNVFSICSGSARNVGVVVYWEGRGTRGDNGP